MAEHGGHGGAEHAHAAAPKHEKAHSSGGNVGGMGIVSGAAEVAAGAFMPFFEGAIQSLKDVTSTGKKGD